MGTVLLYLVALIPSSAMRDSASGAAQIIYDEGTYPSVFGGTAGTLLDNWTDALMINTAFTRTGSPTADALQATCVSFEGEKWVESLYHLFWGETEAEQGISTYSRYWHGYQVLLCPLLALFSYPTIRSLNMLFETAAVLLLLYLLVRRGMDRLCLPFLVMWMCLSPATLFNSLQYSAVFYSMMGACIVLVWRHDELDAMSRSAVFTVCGVLVAYLDLLTYPLVALGVPLILYLSMDSSRDLTLGRRAGQVLLYSAAWCIGYGGMWASKWVITSLVTDEDVIATALSTAAFRASHSYDTQEYTLLGTVRLNAAHLASAVVVGSVLIAVVLFFVLRARCGTARPNAAALVAIAVVCCYPFVWYAVLMNHSAIHHWMTYRELVIAVYGAVSMLYVLLPGRAGPPAPGPPVGDGRPRGARGAHASAPSEDGAGDAPVEVPAGRHLRSPGARME